MDAETFIAALEHKSGRREGGRKAGSANEETLQGTAREDCRAGGRCVPTTYR